MDARYNQLKAVIFDWAGTIVDFGSRAPMKTFVEVFARHEIEISIAEARQPMGLPKLDHIRALGRLPRIAAEWERAYGRPFTEEDAHVLLNEFVPANMAVAAQYASLIPGALEAVADARARGLKIGSTTGYTRDIMSIVASEAAARGYQPDCLVCAGDLAAGRPTPLMIYKCFVDLEVFPAVSCVKVDDTVPGIAEGLAAGCWTIGVAVSGNEFGLSEEEIASLPRSEFELRRAEATTALKQAGAHFVIDTVADLPSVLDRIEADMAAA